MSGGEGMWIRGIFPPLLLMSASVPFWAFKLDACGCAGTRIPTDVSAEPFGLRQGNRTLFGAPGAPPRRFSLRLRRSAATVPWLRGTAPTSSATCCCYRRCCCCWCCCILTVRSCPAQEIVCDLFNYIVIARVADPGSEIRDPVPFWPRERDGMNNPDHIFFRQLRNNFLG